MNIFKKLIKFKKSDIDLSKFVDTHNIYYETALREVRNGKKLTHWMWFIFPQVNGLGSSITSQRYSVTLEEARVYMAHPILGAHMMEICNAILDLDETNIDNVFDYPDNFKLRSSVTIFLEATGEEIFRKILFKYYNGIEDELTLNILKGENKDGQS